MAWFLRRLPRGGSKSRCWTAVRDLFAMRRSIHFPATEWRFPAHARVRGCSRPSSREIDANRLLTANRTSAGPAVGWIEGFP